MARVYTLGGGRLWPAMPTRVPQWAMGVWLIPAHSRRMAAWASAVVAAVAILLGSTRADDWPQWRGPSRNGVSPESRVLAAWPANRAPVVLWRAQVGRGHSAISVWRGRAYTMGWDGERDTVVCLDALSGKVVWKHSYPCKTIVQWPGPRSTPTVHDGRVFTLGQHGQMHCLNAETGKPIWSRQLAESYQPDVDYGFPWSPLIEDGLVILGAGSNGLALRTSDGTSVWGDDGKHGACASPVPATIAGKRCLVVVTNNARESVSVVGVNPADGKRLWQSDEWPEKWGAACVDPVVSGDSVFLTTAEQHMQCARMTVRGATASVDWANRLLASYTGPCVFLNGHVYGVAKSGHLTCMDWQTGAVAWAQMGFGSNGALVAADALLFVQTSTQGDLMVVRADPARYTEIRRFRAFEGKAATFTPPVISDGRLYCRSYAGEVVCVQIGSGGVKP